MRALRLREVQEVPLDHTVESMEAGSTSPLSPSLGSCTASRDVQTRTQSWKMRARVLLSGRHLAFQSKVFTQVSEEEEASRVQSPMAEIKSSTCLRVQAWQGGAYSTKEA